MCNRSTETPSFRTRYTSVSCAGTCLRITICNEVCIEHKKHQTILRSKSFFILPAGIVVVVVVTEVVVMLDVVDVVVDVVVVEVEHVAENRIEFKAYFYKKKHEQSYR